MRRTSKYVNHAKEVYWLFHLTFQRWYHMTWQKRPNIGFAGFKLPWIQTLSLYWDYWQLTSKINPLKNCSQFELWMSNLLRFSQISLIPAKSAENIKLWSETNWSKDGGEGDGNKTHIPGKIMLHLHRQYRHKKDQISATTCSCCSCPHHIWAESGQEQPSAKSSLQKPRNIIESMQCNWITFPRRVCLQNCSLAAFVFFHYFPFVFRLSLSNVFPDCFLIKHFSTKLLYTAVLLFLNVRVNSYPKDVLSLFIYIYPISHLYIYLALEASVFLVVLLLPLIL